MNKQDELVKQIVFRMPENIKIDLRIALMKNKLSLQHTFEAFAEIFIAYAQGDKFSDAMKVIIKRSQALAGGGNNV